MKPLAVSITALRPGKAPKRRTSLSLSSSMRATYSASFDLM
jgi:hypothetical protein